MMDLGALPGRTYSCAYGINEKGQVVGESRTGLVAVQPMPSGAPSSVKEQRTPLSAQAFQSVPRISVIQDGIHAFLWSEVEGMRDLGHLGGHYSSGKAVNNHDLVVDTLSKIIEQTPLHWLVYFQALRISAVGTAFETVRGTFPESFELFVGVPDLLFGLSALYIGRRAQQGAIARRNVAVWNLVGAVLDSYPRQIYSLRWACLAQLWCS